MGHDERAAEEPWAPVLSAVEPGAGGGRVRSLRGEALRAVLRWAGGSSEPAAGALLPIAAAGVLRGSGLRARDCLACCGLIGDPEFSWPWAGRAWPRPLDDLPDSTLDRRGDAQRGVRLGFGAAGASGLGEGQDAAGGRHDPGSERGDAEHRATGHGRDVPGLPDGSGEGVGDPHADASGAGTVGPAPGEEGLERGMEEPVGSRREDHEDERRADPPGAQGRARRGRGVGCDRGGDACRTRAWATPARSWTRWRRPRASS